MSTTRHRRPPLNDPHRSRRRARARCSSTETTTHKRRASRTRRGDSLDLPRERRLDLSSRIGRGGAFPIVFSRHFRATSVAVAEGHPHGLQALLTGSPPRNSAASAVTRMLAGRAACPGNSTAQTSSPQRLRGGPAIWKLGDLETCESRSPRVPGFQPFSFPLRPRADALGASVCRTLSVRTYEFAGDRTAADKLVVRCQRALMGVFGRFRSLTKQDAEDLCDRYAWPHRQRSPANV